MNRLGQILLRKHLISETELDEALAIANSSKSRLGDVLVATGIIGYLPLYEALAEHYQLDFINLLDLEPDRHLLDERHLEYYIHLRALPYLRHNNIVYIATSELSQDLLVWAKSQFGEALQFAITSPIDISRTVQKYFSDRLSHQSRFTLFETMPNLSARTKMRNHTRYGCFALIALLALSIWIKPAPIILGMVALCYALYSITLAFKMVVYLAGRLPKPLPPPAAIPDTELPCYTILIPMYQETESLPGMLEAIQRMDYPPAKIDVKLILEEDDIETIRTAKILKPRYQFDIVIVPPSLPRTKPKACNYALRFARGDYVTVYDADDRPAPDQLKKAVHLLKHSPPEVICLQARLNYYNTHDNWLTRCFSLEYAMLFNVMLYGLSRLHIPILLGGTSNHISVEKLRALGEWDPFNVTEDADLGARLALRGYTTLMLDSDTLEEAPNTLCAWLKQRTRWVKGYMQTWIVHMRAPRHMLKSYKIQGFIGFQCFVALASFSYLTAPIVWMIAIIWLISGISFFPLWIYYVASTNLIINFLLHIVTALDIARFYKNRRGWLVLPALTYPFYLILHTIASYMALYQLWAKPYTWNKTTHGCAKTFNNQIIS